MDAAGTSKWIGGKLPLRKQAGSAGAFESARLLRVAVALCMLLLAFAGVVLIGRRLSGALVSPPSAATLGFVGVLLAAAGLALRRMLVAAALLPGIRLAVMLLPSMVGGLWLVALSLPATSGWGLVLLFSPVLLAEGWSWGRFARHLAAAPANSALTVTAVATAAPSSTAPTTIAATSTAPPTTAPLQNMPATSLVDDGHSEACEGEHTERDVATLHQQTRRRDDEAGEVIEGWVRVDFAAGQRHAAAHIGICPPLEQHPTCYAEPAEGPDAGVKITQAMSYGVRLEVKLDEPAEEPASVIVEYSIFEHAAEDV